ncbi:MAG: hypothetical protein FVQ80_11120 [Planctomycetes bacterium]|nr:hypothetical protein [Planctomycetota bacterium]
MQGDVYLSNDKGVRINPALEENQVLIVNELAESTAKNSLSFGTEQVTLDGGGLAVGGNQVCRTALVTHTNSNATYVGNTADGDADATSFLLPADEIVPIPIRNTDKLSFFGTVADTVHILWRD